MATGFGHQTEEGKADMIRFTAMGLEISVEVARALLAFMSDDDSRRQLCGIGIDEGDVCATDGQAAVRFERVEVDGCSPMSFNRRVFSRAFVEAQVKARGTGKAAIVLPWVQLEPEHVQFARLSQAEPKDGVRGDDLPIAWDAAILAKLTIAARACRREKVAGEVAAPHDPPAMLTSLGGYLDPMRFTIGGEFWSTSVHEAFVTIMPMNMRANGVTGDEKTLQYAREKQAKKAAEDARKARASEERKRQAAARKAAKLAAGKAEGKAERGAVAPELPGGDEGEQPRRPLPEGTREDEAARRELSRLSPGKLSEAWTARDAQKQVLSNVLHGRTVTREQRAAIGEYMEGRPLWYLGVVVAEVLGEGEVAA